MSILIDAEKLKQYKQEILLERQNEKQSSDEDQQRFPSHLDPSQYSFFSDFYPQMPFCLGEAADSYLLGLNKNINTNRNEKPPESYLVTDKKDGKMKKRLLPACQRFALPLMLEGKNVLCVDRAGSGKTVAMIISAINRCGVSNLLRDYYPDYSNNNEDDDDDDQELNDNSSNLNDVDSPPKPRLPQSSVFYFFPTRELTRAAFEIFCRIVEKLHPVVLQVEDYVTRKTDPTSRSNETETASNVNDEMMNRDLYLQNLAATKKFMRKRVDMPTTENLRGVTAPYGAVLYGGTSMLTMNRHLKIMLPPMIFGTCGRTLDTVQRRGDLVPTHAVCGVYFDELDALHELGFEEQITELMKIFVQSAEERRAELQVCASSIVLHPRSFGSDEEPFKKLIENFVVPSFFASENREGAPMYYVDTMNSHYYRDSQKPQSVSPDDNDDEAFYQEQESTLLKNFVITTNNDCQMNNKIDQLLKLILKLRFNEATTTDVDMNWPCFVFVKNDNMLQTIKKRFRETKQNDETVFSILRDYFYFVPSKFEINQVSSSKNIAKNWSPSLRFDSSQSSIPPDLLFRRVLFCAVSADNDDNDDDTGSRKKSSSNGIVLPNFPENFHGSIVINFDVFSTLVAKKVEQEKNHMHHVVAHPNSVLPSVLYQDELSKLIQQEVVICPDYQYFIGDRKFSSTRYKKEELLMQTLLHNPKLNNTLFPLLTRFRRDNNESLEIDGEGLHLHNHPLLIADQYLRRIPNVSMWEFRNQKIVYSTQRPNPRRGDPVPPQQLGALHQTYNFFDDERDVFALLAVESVYKIRFHKYEI